MDTPECPLCGWPHLGACFEVEQRTSLGHQMVPSMTVTGLPSGPAVITHVVPKPPFDRGAYQRWYMKNVYRPRKKAEKDRVK